MIDEPNIMNRSMLVRAGIIGITIWSVALFGDIIFSYKIIWYNVDNYALPLIVARIFAIVISLIISNSYFVIYRTNNILQKGGISDRFLRRALLLGGVIGILSSIPFSGDFVSGTFGAIYNILNFLCTSASVVGWFFAASCGLAVWRM